MSKKDIFKKIYTHIYEKQNYYLDKIEINNVSDSVSNLKQEIITNLNISNDEWKDSLMELKPFIHSLILFNYILKNKPDIFTKVLECPSQDEMTKLFSDSSIKSQLNNANLNSSYFTARAYKSILKVAKLHKTNPPQNNSDENKIPNEKINDTSNKNCEPNSNTDSSTNDIPKPKSLTTDELARKIENDKKLSNNFSDMTDEEITNAIKEKFNDTYTISDAVIDEYISSRDKASSINISDSKLIKKLAILEKSSAEKIKTLTSENNELITKVSTLTNENYTLASQLDDTNKELEKYKTKIPNKSTEHIFSVELKELNKLLNGNSDESQITIKNELLNRASKYADKHGLIQTEYIISQNKDLKSEIVQLILLGFLHEKSLF